MEIVNGYKSFKSSAKPIVITIGNFDGVHVGHKAILKEMIKRADELGGIPVVMTFDPHPITVLSPAKRLELISTKASKLKRFEEAGIKIAIVEEFNKKFADLSARKFFEDILLKGLKVEEIFIGYDFNFGRHREGTPDLMKKFGEEFKIPVTIIPPFKVNNEIVSATLIREVLLEGDLIKSQRLLGYPYELQGQVIKGAGRGKGLGYPTANIKTVNQIIPHKGIYITEAILDRKTLQSVTSIGVRPTFKEIKPALVIEVLIFDFNKEIYGKEITVRFLKRIRDEEEFPSIEELKKAIKKDVSLTKEYFSKT